MPRYFAYLYFFCIHALILKLSLRGRFFAFSLRPAPFFYYIHISLPVKLFKFVGSKDA